MKKTIAGVDIPDGAIAQAATSHVCAIQSELMFHHSLRAFLFGALIGYRDRLTFDMELLYVGAMFHNVGLNSLYHRSPFRYEVDSASAARDFLLQYGVAQAAIKEVWDAIALHTTPGIPEYMSSLIALVSAGVQMDVRGARYHDFTAQQRDEIVRAYPRETGFKYGAPPRDDFRHGQRRCARPLGPELSPIEFLRAGAGIGLAWLTACNVC
jgi:hypothetical protein